MHIVKMLTAGVLLAAGGAASAATAIDQAQLTFNLGMPFGFPDGSGGTVSNHNVGQSYTAGVSKTLAAISLYCNGICSIDQLGNTVTLSLYDGNGLLGTSVLTTTNGTPDTSLPGFSILRFDFASQHIGQVAGAGYTFVVDSVSGPGDLGARGILLRTGNPYAGGSATATSFYGEQPDWDLTFKTEVAVGSVPEPASWALLIGGFALTGVATRRRARAAA